MCGGPYESTGAPFKAERGPFLGLSSFRNPRAKRFVEPSMHTRPGAVLSFALRAKDTLIEGRGRMGGEEFLNLASGSTAALDLQTCLSGALSGALSSA